MTTHTTTSAGGIEDLSPDLAATDLLIERLSNALTDPQVEPGDTELRYCKAYGRLLYLVAHRQPDLAEAIIEENAPKVTFDQFMASAVFDRPHQRDGQAAFNALYEIRPDLANAVRAKRHRPLPQRRQALRVLGVRGGELGQAMTPLPPDIDLRTDEWPDASQIRAARWNHDRTALIFDLADDSQYLLQVREPVPPDPAPHIDLTVMERVDSVISERMR